MRCGRCSTPTATSCARGCGWRLLPGDLPPWKAVYDQAARWHAAGVFEALIADLRGMIRLGEGRSWHPSAAVLDSRTLKSTASSEGAAYDGAKRVKGASCTWRSTRWATCWRRWSARPTRRTGPSSPSSAPRCRPRSRARHGAFVDQGYTGAAPGPRPPGMASSCWS
jgi:transposase